MSAPPATGVQTGVVEPEGGLCRFLQSMGRTLMMEAWPPGPLRTPFTIPVDLAWPSVVRKADVGTYCSEKLLLILLAPS